MSCHRSWSRCRREYCWWNQEGQGSCVIPAFLQESCHAFLSPTFVVLSLSLFREAPRIYTFYLLLQCGMNLATQGWTIVSFHLICCCYVGLLNGGLLILQPQYLGKSRWNVNRGSALPWCGETEPAYTAVATMWRCHSYKNMSSPYWLTLFCNNGNYLINWKILLIIKGYFFKQY